MAWGIGWVKDRITDFKARTGDAVAQSEKLDRDEALRKQDLERAAEKAERVQAALDNKEREALNAKRHANKHEAQEKAEVELDNKERTASLPNGHSKQSVTHENANTPAGQNGHVVPVAAHATEAQSKAQPIALKGETFEGRAGKEIEQIQKLVGANPDGIVGPETQEAIKKFQRAHNLAADGIVGKNTLEALNHDGPSTSLNVSAKVNKSAQIV